LDNILVRGAVTQRFVDESDAVVSFVEALGEQPDLVEAAARTGGYFTGARASMIR
jgi:hypothetical protein